MNQERQAARWGLWLRWTWRDLRGRWLLVTVIALVIALGTGTYAALLSTSAWRTQSNDASFALLHTHNLRAALATGSTVPEGRLLELVRGLPHASQVAAVRERLIVPTQVAAQHGVLVPGEIAGTAEGSGPGVDNVYVSAGHALAAADDGQPAVILEQGFARQNHLPDSGTLRLSGGHTALRGGPSSVPGIVSPRKITVKGAPAARRLLRNRRPLSSDLARQVLGTYRKDGAERGAAQVPKE